MQRTDNLLARDLDEIVDTVQPLFEALRGERIFITGGTGFFGKWLVESLLWANDNLDLKTSAVILTRDPDQFRQQAPHLADRKEILLWQGDITKFDFPDGNFRFVIHGAFDSSVAFSEDRAEQVVDTIVSGTRRALEFASSHGTDRFLLVSSGAVYGEQPAELDLLNEDFRGGPDLMRPSSVYAEGKRMAELYAALAGRKSNMEIKIARCFAFVGPYLPLDVHFAIGNFIRCGLDGNTIGIKGDGTAIRSYLYASELTIWLWTILFKGQQLRPYNVGSETGYSIREVAEMVSRQFSPPLGISIAGRPDPIAGTSRFIPSTKRAQEELGLTECIDLPEALKRTIAWQKALQER